MTFEEFDQTQEAGWRAIAKRGDFAGAAQAIIAYLATRPEWEAWQERTLHFHAAQMFAFAGNTNAALAHLPATLEPDDVANDPANRWRWNDYVAATEAFLREDLPALHAARERIAQGPEVDGAIPNLSVVDRLIANFGKPYAQAY